MMKTIKFTNEEYKIVQNILENLSEQIDEEVVNLVPADASDEEADAICNTARNALSKLF